MSQIYVTILDYFLAGAGGGGGGGADTADDLTAAADGDCGGADALALAEATCGAGGAAAWAPTLAAAAIGAGGAPGAALTLAAGASPGASFGCAASSLKLLPRSPAAAAATGVPEPVPLAATKLPRGDTAPRPPRTAAALAVICSIAEAGRRKWGRGRDDRGGAS